MSDKLETESLLSKFKLNYESLPDEKEMIAEAMARNWARGYRKFVLFMNKAGLLHKLRFGRRA